MVVFLLFRCVWLKVKGDVCLTPTSAPDRLDTIELHIQGCR